MNPDSQDKSPDSEDELDKDQQESLEEDSQSKDNPQGSTTGDQANIDFFKMGVVVEIFLAVLALVLASMGLFAPDQYLSELSFDTWKTGLLFGLLGALPMIGYLVVFHYWKPDFMEPMETFVQTHLVPMFKSSSILQLLILSLLAGFCEELLFRWCIQGGLNSLAPGALATFASLVAASVLFGICHWVNNIYGILTMIIGAYLGLLMIWTGTFLAPAIAHALYDFVAMIYIVKRGDKSVAA